MHISNSLKNFSHLECSMNVIYFRREQDQSTARDLFKKTMRISYIYAKGVGVEMRVYSIKEKCYTFFSFIR